MRLVTPHHLSACLTPGVLPYPHKSSLVCKLLMEPLNRQSTRYTHIDHKNIIGAL